MIPPSLRKETAASRKEALTCIIIFCGVGLKSNQKAVGYLPNFWLADFCPPVACLRPFLVKKVSSNEEAPHSVTAWFVFVLVYGFCLNSTALFLLPPAHTSSDRVAVLYSHPSQTSVHGLLNSSLCVYHIAICVNITMYVYIYSIWVELCSHKEVT